MIPILFSVLCFALAAWFISSELAGHMAQATLLKGCASLMFVCLGVWALLQGGSPFGTLVMVGLVLGMIGDVFLNLRFQYTGGTSNKVFAVGITAFLAGHFLYIAALLSQGAPPLPAAVLTAVLGVLSLPPLMRSVTAPSKGLEIFGYVYMLVILFMFSLAVTLLVLSGPTPLRVVFVCGALLFLASDFMMIYYSFGKKLKPLRVANLLLYYAAQCLIAYSITLAL